jgi:hypothetical protein
VAGDVWFSELKFPRKQNPRRPIEVRNGPRQLLSNLPPGSSRRRPVWSAAVPAPADCSRGERYRRENSALRVGRNSRRRFARRRFACQGEVALEYLVSAATDLDVRSVAVECLIVL